MRLAILALALGLLASVSACTYYGSPSSAGGRVCQFGSVETARLQLPHGVLLNVILDGNATTTGHLYDAKDDSMPIAPTASLLKNYANTGGPYILQYYGFLSEGDFILAAQGPNSPRAIRNLTLADGTETTIQVQCP